MAYDQARYDELSKRDSADLSVAEAEELAILRSQVSLKDYDPSTLENEGDRVVEDADRRSTTLGELASDESQPVSVRIDAQAAVDNPPPSSPVFQKEQEANVAASAPSASKEASKPSPTSTTVSKSDNKS